jgi:ankyrin repeat protein
MLPCLYERNKQENQPMRQTIFSLSALALIAGTIIMTEATLPGHHAAAHAQAETSLLQAAASGDLAAVKAAIKAGADLEARGKNGETALLAATHGNHIEVAGTLIDAGADVNAKDAIKDSPYLYAGARGHLEILKMTLAHGADLKSTNRYGGTALIPASERGHVETVRC